MIRRPPRSTLSSSSAASDVYKRQVIVHPECIPEVQDIADYIASTSGMVEICKTPASGDEFLVGTEIGLLHRLKKEAPDKKFYPISTTAGCPQMKMHTLEKIASALDREEPEVIVPAGIKDKARRAIERMFTIIDWSWRWRFNCQMRQ